MALLGTLIVAGALGSARFKPRNAAKPAPSGMAPKINDLPAPEPSPRGMKWIPGGIFAMGCPDCGLEDALPVHWVEIDGFWMDETPVTNAQFEQFADATGYVTVAERKPKAEDFPGVPESALVPGSAVFAPPEHDIPLFNAYAWWRYVSGASWRHPEGPGSDLDGRRDHPAVQVAYEDAHRYCAWARKALPTEAQYELAARGGLHGKRYSWGDELKPGGRWPANIWQGKFPTKNTAEDGYRGTSPVKAFPPNGYGLYDMAGNVWQWTEDWYRPDTYPARASQPLTKQPRGPDRSFDPQEPGVKKRVQRGGSFLCSDRYCTRYLVGSRGKGAVDSGSSNVGFRCIQEVAP